MLAESRSRYFQDKYLKGFKWDNPVWPVSAGILLKLVHLMMIESSPILRLLIIDSGYYHRQALEIASGDILGSGIFFMSPLYPYLMGILYSVILRSPFVIAVFQICLSGVTLWLLWKITNELAGRRAACYTSWAGALFPVWIYFDSVILTASTILFLNTISVWFLLKWTKTGKVKNLAAAGFFIGLSILTRPGSILFAAGVLIWLSAGKKIKPALFFLAAVLLTLLPITLRNFSVSGEAALTTASGGMNFHVGNNPHANGLYYEPDFLRSAEPEFEYHDYIEQAEKLSLKELSPVEASRFWYRTGFVYLMENPGKALKLYWNKFFYFWNNLEAPNNVSYYLAQRYSPLLSIMFWGFGLLGALGMAGMIFLKKSDATVILWLYLGSIILTNMLFFTSSEFRFPALTALLPGLGFLLAKLYGQIRTKIYDWKVISAVVLFLAVSHYRTPLAEGLSSPRMDYFNYGSVSLGERNYHEAIAYLQAALREDPGFMPGHMALGTAYLELGDYTKAAAEFRLAGYIVSEDELEEQYKTSNQK